MNFKFDTHMDFVGQKRAERIYQSIISLFAIIGFVHGWKVQQTSITVYYTLVGIALSIFLIVPPWPFFRRHPIKWRLEKKED